MTMIVPVEDFQIGRVVSRTFGVFGRNVVTFLTIAAIVMAPVLAINIWQGSNNYLAVGVAKGWAMGTLAGILPLLCTYLLQAALVQATVTDLNGTRPSLGSALSSGFSLFLPVLLLAIVSLLGLGLGFVLLFVPGLILMTGWSVLIPVRVAEHTAFADTFGRSWDLTKGYRWKIFVLLIMYGIVALLLGYVARLITGVSFAQAATATNSLPYIAVTWVESVVVGVIMAIGVAAVYYELRTVKEGMAPEQLAAAFD